MSSVRSIFVGEDGKLTSREAESDLLMGHARREGQKAVDEANSWLSGPHPPQKCIPLTRMPK